MAGFKTDYQPFFFSTYGMPVYYNPEKGRWLNRYPLEEKGSVILFGLLNNNVINEFDLLGLSGAGNAYKIFGLALGTVLPMYRASLSVCWERERTCHAGCGLVSSYTATIVSGAYATCMAANALNPIGWITCKVGFAKALSLTKEIDAACKEACKTQTCCEAGAGMGYGDPGDFVIEITL